MDVELTSLSEAKPSTSENRYEKGQDQVVTAWFPPNPALFERVRQTHLSGLYSADRNLFLEDLKSDLSLFGHCLGALWRTCWTKGVSPSDEPMELLFSLPEKEFSTIVPSSLDVISTHTLSDTTKFQAQAIERALVNALATEALCKASDLPSDRGYICGLIRQLGLVLASYNYPHVVSRALYNPKRAGSLDSALTRMLGFSTQELAGRYLQTFHVEQEFQGALESSELSLRHLGSEDPRLKIQAFSHLGETLANALNPALSPKPDDDWKDAIREVRKQLGWKGFELLQERLFKAYECYLDYAPHLFTVPDVAKVLEPLPVPSMPEFSSALLSRNTYLKYCPGAVREKIERLYRNLVPYTLSKETILTLAQEVIPMAGFSKGCIYLLDPEKNMLMPRLAIGSAKLNAYQPISPGATHADQPYNPVAEAYQRSMPIMEHRIEVQGVETSYVAGLLGPMSRGGVLYLEIAPGLLTQVGANPMVRFKALAQVLCDCLQLF